MPIRNKSRLSGITKCNGRALKFPEQDDTEGEIEPEPEWIGKRKKKEKNKMK